MALGWTWADIRSKIRQTTGRPDVSMMTNATILDYANKYMQYVLPKELKIFWGYTYFQFYTTKNIDQYPQSLINSNGMTIEFQTLNPEAWVDGYCLEWNIDPGTFYSDYPTQLNKLVVGLSDGTNNFTFQISRFPILAWSVYVTDGTQVVQDIPTGTTGSGSFIDFATGLPVSGSIDYASGLVSNLSFTNVPAANLNITCTYQTFLAARPREILYYKSKPLANSTLPLPNATVPGRDSVNMFVLRPVPDDVYLIKMQGIQVPAPFINDTDVPFRTDLGPLIAYGASLEIFADFNQMDQYDQTLVQYNRYKDVSMQDTYEEYIYERSIPKF